MGLRRDGDPGHFRARRRIATHNMPGMTPREMLTAPMAFLAPAAALDGLTPAAADQRLPGANHSIAEIVAHLAFWQQWFLRRFNGVAEPMVQRAGEGWPAVTPGAWGEVEGAFRSGLILLVSEAEKATGAGRWS